jgi:hypothetical protein
MFLAERKPNDVPGLFPGATLYLHPNHPDVTISVWTNGCVCQAVPAPGSKVTVPPPMRAGPLP